MKKICYHCKYLVMMSILSSLHSHKTSVSPVSTEKFDTVTPSLLCHAVSVADSEGGGGALKAVHTLTNRQSID